MNPHQVASDSTASATSSLFDEHGRCIPVGLTAEVHRKTRRYFGFTQPEIKYADIHERISKHLGVSVDISATEFEQRATAILQKLRDNPQTSGITKGVGIPFFLPKADYADYGEALESTYLHAVHSSFAERLPEYLFVNHHKGGLAGKLGIAPQSRHQRLVAAMQQAPVVGYFFPCLTEYSIPATLEQIGMLPEQFLLAGGFDTSAALIGSPDLLLRTDGYPPLLWLAALTGEKENVGYHFEAYGYNLTFNRRPHFGQVAEYWASGLVVLG
ncbi:MAG: hypothetical protein KJ958_02745 [Gammaproteobacteria bacterium]|nr:hypothetical protein [Gammaproteobacteria bacterium]MBU1978069.1 hypothetical protein [Gammaproteobacteria bacterium]